MQASSGSRVPSEDGASGLGPSCAPQVPFDLSVAPSHAATVSEQLVRAYVVYPYQVVEYKFVVQVKGTDM